MIIYKYGNNMTKILIRISASYQKVKWVKERLYRNYWVTIQSLLKKSRDVYSSDSLACIFLYAILMPVSFPLEAMTKPKTGYSIFALS